MKIQPGCAQHIGARKEQQDSFGFSHIEDASLVRRSGVLVILADGMGGMAMGRESSDAAVKAVLSAHESSLEGKSPVSILGDAVEKANKEVFTIARNAGVAGDSGSTLVAAILKDNYLYWTSVGDSRIYLYRSRELVQLTKEQNFETNLLQRVAAGNMTREEALNHPERAGLTNFIGSSAPKPADASIRPFPIKNGDWIILCSDGLYGTLTDDEIREELTGNPNEVCERLVNKTKMRDKPHQDNVTIAILSCCDNEPVTVRTRKSSTSMEHVGPKLRKKNIPTKLVTGLLAISAVVIVTFIAIFCLILDKPSSPKQLKSEIVPHVKNRNMGASTVQTRQSSVRKQPKKKL